MTPSPRKSGLRAIGDRRRHGVRPRSRGVRSGQRSRPPRTRRRASPPSAGVDGRADSATRRAMRRSREPRCEPDYAGPADAEAHVLHDSPTQCRSWGGIRGHGVEDELLDAASARAWSELDDLVGRAEQIDGLKLFLRRARRSSPSGRRGAAPRAPSPDRSSGPGAGSSRARAATSVGSWPFSRKNACNPRQSRGDLSAAGWTRDPAVGPSVRALTDFNEIGHVGDFGSASWEPPPTQIAGRCAVRGSMKTSSTE